MPSYLLNLPDHSKHRPGPTPEFIYSFCKPPVSIMTKNLSRAAFVFAFFAVFNFACKKEIEPQAPPQDLSNAADKLHGHLQQTKTFSSDVITTWINTQLQMLKVPLPPGTGSQATERCQAYCGIAAYEAVVNGMPSYQTLSGQL